MTNIPAARDPGRPSTLRCRLQPRYLAAPIFGILLLVTAVPGDAADTYYRWTDVSGRLVVSDRPPQDPDIEYEVVSQRSPLVRRVRPGEGAVPAEVTPRPGNEFEAREGMAGEDAIPKNPETCTRARQNLETLNTAARIRVRDPDTGELSYLSEDDKEEQRERAMEMIRIHCE